MVPHVYHSNSFEGITCSKEYSAQLPNAGFSPQLCYYLYNPRQVNLSCKMTMIIAAIRGTTIWIR